MNLIILYGAPASGKLTVARALAEITKYKLLHNHLFFDLALGLFDKLTKEVDELYNGLHFVPIEYALKYKIPGVILTICSDDARKKKVFTQIQEKYGSADLNILFVQVLCDKEKMLARVENSDRKEFKKILDPIALEKYLNSKDFFSKHNDSNTLSINTSKLSSSVNAKKIAEFID